MALQSIWERENDGIGHIIGVRATNFRNMRLVPGGCGGNPATICESFLFLLKKSCSKAGPQIRQIPNCSVYHHLSITFQAYDTKCCVFDMEFHERQRIPSNIHRSSGLQWLNTFFVVVLQSQSSAYTMKSIEGDCLFGVAEYGEVIAIRPNISHCPLLVYGST